MRNPLAQNFANLSLKPINEVAAEIGIEPYILRFWESKFPQISPTKGKGNRRLYNNQDIETIKNIKELLYEQGFTIEGAKKYLNNQSIDMKNPANNNNLEQHILVKEAIKELKELRSELQDL